MRSVPVGHGRVALVDDEDYDRVLAAGPWHTCNGRHTRYARKTLYDRDARRFSVRAMHGFITGWSMVDHIDGDGLNNCRSNLRPATHAQNMANKRTYRNNRSGFKGVHWQSSNRKWIATAGRRYVGCFDTAEAAARAYDAAAISLWGEYARVNFPALKETA